MILLHIFQFVFSLFVSLAPLFPEKNALMKSILILCSTEIIERVITRDENGHPFRPRLSEISSTPKFITDVIKECWDEEPMKRPDFKGLRTKLKPMQKGM